MGKAAAVEGDTVATASAATAPSTQPTWQGAWTAGAVSETSYPKLAVEGVKVIHEARCTFSFSGGDTASNGAPVSTNSTVTLRAGTTLLQKANSKVLVNGDNASDSHGNRLEIVAAGALTTL